MFELYLYKSLIPIQRQIIIKEKIVTKQLGPQGKNVIMFLKLFPIFHMQENIKYKIYPNVT